MLAPRPTLTARFFSPVASTDFKISDSIFVYTVHLASIVFICRAIYAAQIIIYIYHSSFIVKNLQQYYDFCKQCYEIVFLKRLQGYLYNFAYEKSKSPDGKSARNRRRV